MRSRGAAAHEPQIVLVFGPLRTLLNHAYSINAAECKATRLRSGGMTAAAEPTRPRARAAIRPLPFAVCEFLLVCLRSVDCESVAPSLRGFESLHATFLGFLGASLAANGAACRRFCCRPSARSRSLCCARSEIGPPPRRPPTCAFRLFPAPPASFPMLNISSLPSPSSFGQNPDLCFKIWESALLARYTSCT